MRSPASNAVSTRRYRSSARGGLLLLASFVALFAPASAAGHAVGSSLVEVVGRADEVTVALALSPHDLLPVVAIDADRDEALSASEVRAGAAVLAEATLDRVTLSRGGQRCLGGVAEVGVEPGGAIRIANVRSCPGDGAFSLELGHLERLAPGHRVIGRARIDGRSTEFVADLGSTQIVLEGGGFGHFVRLGVEHILAGWDHLLFLAALLLVLRSVREALAVVTSFTVAHSITLGLGAFEVLAPPSRLVEALIAASVLYVAAENIVRERPRARTGLTFGFGLVHGFGFAGLLGELGIPAEGRLPALFGFNLGVELGQLGVLALVAPLLAALRRSAAYERRLMPLASAAIGGCGAYWLVDRLLGG